MSTDREAIAQTILTTPLTAEWQEAIRCRAAMEQPGEIITLMREWCAALVLGTEPRGPLPAITVYSGPTSAQPADPAACEHGQIAEHPMESEAELGVNPTLDCPGPSPAVLPQTETENDQR